MEDQRPPRVKRVSYEKFPCPGADAILTRVLAFVESKMRSLIKEHQRRCLRDTT